MKSYDAAGGEPDLNRLKGMGHFSVWNDAIETNAQSQKTEGRGRKMTQSAEENAGGDFSKTPVDEAMDVLASNKDAWAKLDISKKVALLKEIQTKTGEVAQEWVRLASSAKGVSGTALEGEEWMSGPWALAGVADHMAQTLNVIARGGDPTSLYKLQTRADGQVVADVHPADIFEWLYLNGVKMQVWMQPEVTRENFREHVAAFYSQENPQGKVAVVLGAGNINSIPPLDMLTKLFQDGEVVAIKLNPVNDYLVPVLEKIFESLVDAGFVRFLRGGVDVGSALCTHPLADTLHMTGSENTFNAIVFGPGPDGEERRKKDEPINEKPMTSELGGVIPTLVVPGPWTDEDLNYQAHNIATQRMHNNGHNCAGAQVVILPEGWEHTDELSRRISRSMANAPWRPHYYPGTPERLRAFAEAHDEVEELNPEKETSRLYVKVKDPYAKAHHGFEVEVFGPAMVETRMGSAEAIEFLDEAVEFANDNIRGTLGVQIMIHPKTMKDLGPRLEEYIAKLRFGAIGINIWCAGAFLLPRATWGGFPGHVRNDIQSGVGVVHNGMIFEKPQKSVCYAPWSPFPRSVFEGEMTLLPHPPWFVTNPRAHDVSRRITYAAVKPGWRHVPGVFFDALRAWKVPRGQR
jgi:aldehyde dehydrogenase (NAD(P)+)